MLQTNVSPTSLVPAPRGASTGIVARLRKRIPGRVRASGWTLLKVALLSTGLWLVVGLVSFLHTLWLGVGETAPALRLSLLEWGPWIVVTPVVVALAVAVAITPKNWKWSVPVHLAVSLGVALAINALTMSVVRQAVRSGPPPHERPEGPRATFGGPARVGFGGPRPAGGVPVRAPLSQATLLNARLTLPIYWLIVVAVHAWRHHRVALEREGRAMRAEREAVRARLAALQAQLQPHFLFNSLNAIIAFIHQRPAAAEAMVCALSNLLRRILCTAERPEIPLAEELDFARDYLAIQRIRFDDTLKVRWDIDPAADAALVPPLIFQPLIENALEHGLRGAAGEIAIQTCSREGRLVLTVGNEAAGAQPDDYSPPASQRVGLRNTRGRLEALFGADYRLDLELLPHGARAVIELPFRTAATS